MRRGLLMATTGAALAAGAVLGPVQAAPPSAGAPAGAISSNVQFVTNLPLAATAISINFIGDTLFVSTETGLQSYDVSNPQAPQLLGVLPQPIWENEDVDVDPERHLVFISRDPRPPVTTAVVSSTYVPKGTIEVIDVSNPAAMTVKNVIVADAWHTTTCIEKCQWLWSGGPFAFHAPVGGMPADWNGRPIFGVDLHDPANPVPCPQPIDLHRNDGKTDYAHDVQVDPRGIAWVSGFGGVRGYWTHGRHYDPISKKTRTATGCAPVPYAGGGTDLGHNDAIMHNAMRNPAYAVSGRKGDLLVATEEDVVSDCRTAGKAATFDLKGTYNGEGFVNTAKTKQRMKQLDTWSPERQKGSTGCASAHYFSDLGHGVMAWAFYEQGTRFLDVSDPRHIKQVGYYRPDDATVWAAYPHKGYVYVADNSRGIDVIRFRGKSAKALAAPALPSTRVVGAGWRPSEGYAWMCRSH